MQIHLAVLLLSAVGMGWQDLGGVVETLACEPLEARGFLGGQFREPRLCPEEATGRRALYKRFAEMGRRDVFCPSAALCGWAAVGRLSLRLSHRTSPGLSTASCSCLREARLQHSSQLLESAQRCSHGRRIAHLRLVHSTFPLLLLHRDPMDIKCRWREGGGPGCPQGQATTG